MPVVKSARRIDTALLTSVLPNNNVHNKRLPLVRIGIILFAYSLSLISPADDNTFKDTRSRLKSPKVKPLKRAEKQMSNGAREMETATGIPLPVSIEAT
jgi:hypothetical protein